MHRVLTRAIPLFVAAAAFVLSSTPLAAQQEHEHGSGTAAGHSCACCGNSSGAAMNHTGGCCGSMASSQTTAQDHSAHQTPPAEKAGTTPIFQSMAGCSADGAATPTATPGNGGCCGSMAMGKGIGGASPMAMDESMSGDMAALHYLLDNRADIRRTVTMLPNGIDTLTESDKPDIAAQLKAHVAAMYARLKDGRRIHQRDPLFVELFEHADQIDANISYTEKGLRVIETSSDPAVAVLLQKHAEAVNGFLKNGRPEMMKDHLD